MTDYSKRVFEMLVKVLVFRTNHPELIAKDSAADQLFQKLDALFKEISTHSTSQASEKNAVRLSSQERRIARENLQKDLETISRTAASIGLEEFFMPRDRSDRAVANVGKIFARLAEPHKEAFIANHLPEDFL